MRSFTRQPKLIIAINTGGRGGGFMINPNFEMFIIKNMKRMFIIKNIERMYSLYYYSQVSPCI